MEHNPAQPESGRLNIETLPPVDVPRSEWPSHSLLRRARLNTMGDGLEWPHATYEQLPFLREISLVVDNGILCARLAAQFNFDRFVDATTDDNGPAQPLGHVTDRQRFYTRVTDNGFHVVGVFSAATIAGRRRYFQWLTGAWVEIGLSGFLYVRDDLDTHFSEVSGAQLDETQPGATTTSMTPDEEWTMETIQSQFVGEAIVEATQGRTPTPATMPVSASDLLPPPVIAAAPLIEQAPAPITGPIPVTQGAHVADPVASPAEPVAVKPVAVTPVAVTPEVAETLAAALPAAALPVAALPVAETPTVVSSAAPGNAAIQRSIAVALATVAHRADLDLVGASTIDHVARVAESFDPSTDYVRHCAAWLHDALERSDITERDLLEAGILPEIVDIVALLTRHESVDDAVWLSAIAAHPDARAVKIAALADNAAPWRLRRLDAVTRAGIEQVHADAVSALGAQR